VLDDRLSSVLLAYHVRKLKVNPPYCNLIGGRG
jgi:hypothetical protein